MLNQWRRTPTESAAYKLGEVFNRIGLWRSLASALAWGARRPEFKSRQPDQIPKRVTDTGPSSGGHLESNWSPKLDPSLFPSGGMFRLLHWLLFVSSEF